VSSAVHDDESCLTIGPTDTVTRIGVSQARSARITGFDGGDWSGKGSWVGHVSLIRPWMASLPHALQKQCGMADRCGTDRDQSEPDDPTRGGVCETQ